MCEKRRGVWGGFDSCQANVKKLAKSQGSIGEKSFLEKPFIANFTFGAMPWFSNIKFCTAVPS